MSAQGARPLPTLILLLCGLDGAPAARPALPLSSVTSLVQREWRIESPAHRNSYIFRVDKSDSGGPGICTGVAGISCCDAPSTKAWYVAAVHVPFADAASFRNTAGRPLTKAEGGEHALDSWGRRADVLVPGSVSERTKKERAWWKHGSNHLAEAYVNAMCAPGHCCVAKWSAGGLLPTAEVIDAADLLVGYPAGADGDGVGLVGHLFIVVTYFFWLTHSDEIKKDLK